MLNLIACLCADVFLKAISRQPSLKQTLSRHSCMLYPTTIVILGSWALSAWTVPGLCPHPPQHLLAPNTYFWPLSCPCSRPAGPRLEHICQEASGRVCEHPFVVFVATCVEIISQALPPRAGIPPKAKMNSQLVVSFDVYSLVSFQEVVGD